MPTEQLHRFTCEGKRFVIDPETCFCFECDAISWDVLEHYPETPVNRIYHLLESKHDRAELAEVIGELEWLRLTKSILTPPKNEDQKKFFEVERGLKRLTLALPADLPDTRPRKPRWFEHNVPKAAAAPREIGRAAANLLLSRSGTQNDLHLEFRERGHVHHPERIAALSAEALNAARLAGKRLTVAVHVWDIEIAKAPAAIEGHTAGVVLEFQDCAEVAQRLAPLTKAAPRTLSRLARMIQQSPGGANSRVVVRPNHPAFGGVVEALDEAGFGRIELDMDGAYIANPALEPQAMSDALNQTAVYYAQRLLKQHYLRLEPIAALFDRIYKGAPLRRSDPAGTNELAVDEAGGIYPCVPMMGLEEFRAGAIAEGAIDEAMLHRFDDVGSVTTPECIRCWARNLCGGGAAAVHQALSGSFRRPHEPWCDAQRAWMAAAVAAFNLLSSQGVNFERLYNALGGAQKPSLFTLARAALTMAIGVRPIEEADAEMLTRWENWNEAAYFLCNESGLLLATQYDREMDSLHPRGIDHELVLVQRDGAAFGLFKIRPDRSPGAAQAWIYMCDEAHYASQEVRKGFRTILTEAAKQQALRTLTVPVSPAEPGLGAFLEAVGFAKEGVLREALYLHGQYHDVTVYSITFGGRA